MDSTDTLNIEDTQALLRYLRDTGRLERTEPAVLTILQGGNMEIKRVEQFGRLIGTVHRRSHDKKGELAPVFETRPFFETLRIEPYYRYTASRQTAAAAFFADLIEETAATRTALVHGD